MATTSVTTTTVGPDTVGAAFAAERQQKDNLCGCFWATIALRAAGIDVFRGEPVDQDRVALEAGSLLPQGDPVKFVPPGETPRTDYRLDLPLADEPDEGGTAEPPLAAAIESLSVGALAVLPVAGPWRAASVVELVRVVAEASPQTTLLANIDTSRLWGSHPAPALLLAYLAGADVSGPEPDWSVGHFVNIAALVSSAERSLVLVRDTYPGLGWDGHHLQPAGALAAALERADGNEGGVLCVAPAADADGLRGRLESLGLELRHWDNGTPFSATES
jgi:hypothetical protein